MKKLLISLFFLSAASIRAEDTTIKGDSMTLLDKGSVVRFVGHVVLHRGTDILKANEMETSQSRDKVYAKDQVELNRNLISGEKLKAYGDRGFFNTESGDGYLIGEKKLSHVIYNQISSSGTRVMDIFADRFDFSQSNSTGVATGHVFGTTTDPGNGVVYQFWSNMAEIQQASQQLYLSGTELSRVHEDSSAGNRTIEGMAITYNYDKRTFLAEGKAQAVFLDLGKKESQ